MAKQKWQSATSRRPVRKPRAARWSDASRDRARWFSSLIVPATLFVIAVVGLVLILQWLNPVPAPTLFLMTTRSSSDVLPPNDLAANDAQRLAELECFNVSEVHAEPANYERMHDIVSLISQHRPRRPLLAFWKPTTLVVYVNAIGVGLPAPGTTEKRAWLVPEGFDPDENVPSQLLAVSELMTAVSESTADQKLVVLDCQRAVCHPHFGLATAEFVDAAQQEIQAIPESQLQGVSVVYSCGPGEATWPMHPGATSVFGNVFAEGISGAADDVEETGNGDQRVTVNELASFLEHRVGDRVEEHSFARQRPVITYGDDTVLVSVGRREAARPRSIASRGTVETELRNAYTRCLELAQPTAAPSEWAPVKWTMTQESLLAAERLYRAGNTDAATSELATFDEHVADLIAAHKSVREQIELSSPSGNRFLSHSCAVGWTEFDEDSGPDDVDQVLTEFAAGSLTLLDADQRLQEIALEQIQPLACPAQLLRIAVARSRSGADIDEGELRELVGRRLMAEEVAQPQYCLTGPWLRPAIAGSDVARRNLEDQLLRDDWVPVRVGPEHQAGPDVLPQYVVDNERRALLTRSFRLRDRLLAELPFWISFLDRSEEHLLNDDADESSDATEATAPEMDFPRVADTAVRSLIDELGRLHRELSRAPESMTTDDFEVHLESVTESTGHGELELERLDSGLARYALALSQPRSAAPGGDTWRRIDAVLQLPVSMLTSATEAAVEEAEIAQLRVQLLNRSLEDIDDDSASRAISSFSSNDLVEYRKDIRNMYLRLFSVALDPASFASPLAEVNEQMRTSEQMGTVAEEARQATATIDGLLTGAVHKDLVTIAESTHQSDWNRATGMRADVAFRLLHRGLGTDLTVTSPAIQVRTRELSDWLLWQTERVIADFYAAVDDSREPFFVRLAGDLLTASQRLANAEQFLRIATDSDGLAEADELVATETGSEIDSHRARIRRRIAAMTALLESTQLELDPSQVEFRLTASERLNARFSNPREFPIGTAAMKLRSVDIDSQATPDDDRVQFVLRPSALGSDVTRDTSMAAYFRGHEFSASVPISIVTETQGPAVTYHNQNVGSGSLRFRSNRRDQEPLNLLFILDCSQSMAQPDSVGQPRINSLRAVLEAFASRIDADDVRVGIRLFGHTVADIHAQEAHTDTELVVPIGRFGPGPLQGVLRRLRQPLVGHSPIFNALIESRQDFAETGEGRNEIVLISDGADNWASAGEKPGIDELIGAYRGTDIRINTVGYDVGSFSDFTQLQQIAAAGGLDGQSATVKDAQSLLWEVAGLIGLPGYRVLENGRVVHEQSQFAGDDHSLELDPGQYDVEVVGPQNDVLARQAIRVLPAEEHVLIFDSGRLRYQHSPRESARAFTQGDDGQPDLIVLDARPGPDELTLEIGLLHKPASPLNPLPVSIRITALTESGRERQWHLRHLPPNGANLHFPMWRIGLHDWPPGATGVELRVAWNDLPNDEVHVPLDWNLQLGQTAVNKDLSLVQRDQTLIDFNGGKQSAVSLTFVLNERGPGIEDWAVVVSEPVLRARHAYDYEHGTYNIEFVLFDGAVPDQVSAVRTDEVLGDRQLTVTVPLTDTRINP